MGNTFLKPLTISFVHDSLDNKPGISKPILITASDGHDYVLKNNIIEESGRRFNFDASLMQELLVTQIAEKLHVPTPKCVIIKISKDDLAFFSKLRFSGLFSDGLYYAVEYISDTTNEIMAVLKAGREQGQKFVIREWNKIFKNIVNKEAIAKIFALDFLTMNADRFTNPGNIILKEQSDSRYLISIDYGFCFYSPFWRSPSNQMPQEKIALLSENSFDFNKPAAITNYVNVVHRHFMEWSVQHGQLPFGYGIIFSSLAAVMEPTNTNPFQQIVSDIQNLSGDNIEAYLNAIPKEWFVDGEVEKQAYLDFLIRQKFLIKNILNFVSGMGLFTNLKGGKLEWLKENNSNIG